LSASSDGLAGIKKIAGSAVVLSKVHEKGNISMSMFKFQEIHFLEKSRLVQNKIEMPVWTPRSLQPLKQVPIHCTQHKEAIHHYTSVSLHFICT
jgi:hypothetical protein